VSEKILPSWTEAAWISAVSVLVLYPVLILVAPGLVERPPGTSQFPGAEFVQGLGFARWTLGAGVAGWSLRVLGRYTTMQLQITEAQPLIRSGPYAWLRHPMYAATLYLGAGLTLLFLSPVVAVDAVLLFLLARYRASAEERMFLGSPRLGADYERLITQTSRFVPRWCRLRSHRHGARSRKQP